MSDARGSATTEPTGSSRRSFLGGAAAATGGAGVLALAGADVAVATQHGFQGFNNVTDVPPVGVPPGSATGADPTGAANSHAAIQTWINASKGGGLQPGTVYFPPGTYKIGSSLTIPSVSALSGHDEHSVIRADTSSGITHMLLNESGSGNSDIRIEHLTLDANNRTAGNNIVLIRADGSAQCNRIFFSHVRFRNQQTSLQALLLMDANDSIVEDCFFESIKHIALDVRRKCTNVLIAGNTFESCHNDNIAIVHGTPSPARISVLGNLCTVDSSSGNTNQAGSPIVIYGGQRIDVVGNIVTSGSLAGIAINSFIAGVADVVIADNVIAESGNLPSGIRDPNGGHGIYIAATSGQSVRRVEIKSNLITAPGQNGVRLLAHSGSTLDEIAIADNQLWFDQSAGWLTAGAGQGVSAPSQAGAVENLRITGNDIRSAPGGGIRVAGSNNKRLDIQDNRILDSGKSGASQPGINLDSVQSTVVANNRVQDTRDLAQRTQEYGLKIVSPAGENTIVGNVLTGKKSLSGNDSVIHISGTYASDARLRIRDNVGFNPWAGSKTLSGTLSGGPVQIGSFWYWWKEVAVVFEDQTTLLDVPFPADAAPRVLVSTDRQGYTAAAVNVTKTGFTLRVFAAANNASSPAPTQSDSVKAFWVAEPVD
jgi:hypothetical protein